MKRDEIFIIAKMTSKKVWIWGLTPSPPFGQNTYFHFFFFNDDLPKALSINNVSVKGGWRGQPNSNIG